MTTFSRGDRVLISAAGTPGLYAGKVGVVAWSNEWTSSVAVPREPEWISEAVRENETGEAPVTVYMFGNPALRLARDGGDHG